MMENRDAITAMLPRELLDAMDNADRAADMLMFAAAMLADGGCGFDNEIATSGLCEILMRTYEDVRTLLDYLITSQATRSEINSTIKSEISSTPDKDDRRGTSPKEAEAVGVLISRARGAANILADMADSPQYDESTTRAFSFIGDGLLEAATAATKAVNG